MSGLRKRSRAAGSLGVSIQPSRHASVRAPSFIRLRTIAGFALLLYLIPGCGPRINLVGHAEKPEVAINSTSKATMPLSQLLPVIAKPHARASADDVPQIIERDLLEAEQLLIERKFAQALARLRPVLAHAGTHWRTLRVAGLAHAGAGNRSKAKKKLEAALLIVADDLEAQFTMGQLLSADQDNAQAIIAFRTALMCSQEAPDNPLAIRTLHRLADVLRREGYHKAALECFGELSDRLSAHGQDLLSDPVLQNLVLRPELLLAARGELLLKLNRYLEAAQLLKSAFAYDRTQQRPAKLLLAAFVSAGQFRQAESLLLTIAKQPGQASQVPDLARMLCSKAQDAEMPQRISEAFLAENLLEDSLAIALANQAKNIGNARASENILRSVVEATSGNARTSRQLARLLAGEGHHQEALMVLAELLTEAPGQVANVIMGVDQVLSAEPAADIERTFGQNAAANKLAGRAQAFAVSYVAGLVASTYQQDMLAADHFRQAIADRPHFLPAYESLIDALVSAGNHSQITRILAQAQAAAPESYFPSYLHGKVLLADYRFAEASKHLAVAYRKNPRHVPTLLLLAKGLNKTGRANQAASALATCIKLEPDNMEAHRLLFETRVNAGHYKQAGLGAEHLAKWRPRSPDGRILQARLALLTGQTEVATRILRQLRNDGHTSREISILAVKLLLTQADFPIPQEQLASISRRLGDMVVDKPEDQEPAKVLAQLFQRQGEQANAAAVDTWRSLYDKAGHTTLITQNYSEALWRTGQYRQAVNLLRDLVADNPRDLANRRFLIKRLMSMGCHNEAADQCAQAQLILADLMESASGDHRMLTSLQMENLEFFLLADLRDNYLAAARTWVSEDPSDLGVKQLLLGQLDQYELYELADVLLDEWARTDFEGINTYNRAKLELLLKNNDAEKANSFAMEWARNDPTSILPRMAITAVYYQAGLYDQVQAIADQWAEPFIDKPSPDPSATGMTVDNKRSTIDWSRQWAISLLVIRGNYAEAAKRLESFSPLESDNTDLLILHSTCMSELGRQAEAIEAMAMAHGFDTSDPSTSNNLGYLYAQAGIELDKAERMIRKALAQWPEVVSFQDSLAWVFYKQGRISEAGRILDRILSGPENSERDHPVIYDHAGDAMYRLGKKDRAMHLWQQANHLAKLQEPKTLEVRQVLTETTRKIEALHNETLPAVAPLGKGYNQVDVIRN